MLDYKNLPINNIICDIHNLAGCLMNHDCIYTIMEVCGTHTMSIYRYGIKNLLPKQIKLISGTGCPVCVTPSEVIGKTISLAEQPGVILTSFGDMLRVPAGADSLMSCRERGADIRIMLSPLEALQVAKDNPARQVIFLAVGFETTAPLTASVVQLAAEQGVGNFSLLAAHKTMPAALSALFTEESKVDALLCPGHVAAITGADYFDFVPEKLHLPSAIAGFEAVDILLAVRSILRQAVNGEIKLDNCYPRAVNKQGNMLAIKAMDDVYESCDANWRGLGLIEKSGLRLRQEYSSFDAERLFEIKDLPVKDDPRCCCGKILRGKMQPPQCPLFGSVCNPVHPQGACMVSAEGSCAAAYKYRE